MERVIVQWIDYKPKNPANEFQSGRSSKSTPNLYQGWERSRRKSISKKWLNIAAINSMDIVNILNVELILQQKNIWIRHINYISPLFAERLFI